MKKVFIASIIFAAGAAHANSVSFACRGITQEGDRVQISGSYQDRGGSYEMNGNLNVSGTDGEGNSLFSSGGGGGTERFFAEENVTLRSNGEWFNLSAESSNGSRLVIRHKEGSDRDDYVLVDLKPTRTKGPYWHEFNRAKCRFN